MLNGKRTLSLPEITLTMSLVLKLSFITAAGAAPCAPSTRGCTAKPCASERSKNTASCSSLNIADFLAFFYDKAQTS